MKVNNLLITLIVVAAFLLRFINVSNNPPGLTWDEAALGTTGIHLC